MGNLLISLLLSVCISISYSQMIPPRNGSLYDTIELIGLQGFKGERHEVKTEDGYKLVLFRIPPKAPSPVVYLQHGLSLSSDSFVLEKNGLAFDLSRKGYDVWLGNFRGSHYSRSHDKLSTKDTKFWDFTVHEMAYYDIPATIDYILDKTKQPSLYYIGYSMGTTAFYIMASTRPEYNKKVKAMISLSPVVYFTGKMALLAKQPSYINMSEIYMDKWLKADKVEAFPRLEDANADGSHQANCSDIPENFVSLCVTMVEMFSEAIGGQYFPAGMSLKTLLHFRQNVLAGTFRQYDYGSESANQAVYKSAAPPDYDLSLVTCPVVLIFGPNDILADETDVKTLSEKLGKVVEIYKIPDESFAHTDYVLIIPDEDEEDRTPNRLKLYNMIPDWFAKVDKM